MEYGFTGTSQGMTEAQKRTVGNLLIKFGVTVLHLGDCIGADAQTHSIATQRQIRTVGHPPSDPKARAFCLYDVEHAPKPYLIRNLDIADEGKDGLIAAPHGFHEVMRGPDGGTWSTIRRARKFKRKIYIVYPDGNYKEDVWA